MGFDVEIRKVVCSANAIESVNARLCRAVNARGHFPRRTGSDEMPVHDLDEPGSHRQGSRQVSHPLMSSLGLRSRMG